MAMIVAPLTSMPCSCAWIIVEHYIGVGSLLEDSIVYYSILLYIIAYYSTV